MNLTHKQRIDALMQVCEGRDKRVLCSLVKKPILGQEHLETIARIERKNPSAGVFLERVLAYETSTAMVS